MTTIGYFFICMQCSGIHRSLGVHISKKLERMGNLLCCLQVDQSIIAIKERFGKFDEVLEPGCHFMPWCLGRKVAGHLTLRLQQLDVRCETKTKDNVFVNVVASIQYRALANKGSDAFYRLSNTRTQIQAYVFDVIRASVPKLNLDTMLLSRKMKLPELWKMNLKRLCLPRGMRLFRHSLLILNLMST